MQKRRLSQPVRATLGCSGCAGLLLLALLLLVDALFGNPFDANPFDDAAFDRKIWLEDASCSDGGNRRGHMAEDILDHRLHRGMTVAQVTALLDKPEGGGTAAERAKYPAGRWTPAEEGAYRVLVYYLGEEQGGFHNGRPVDRAWLDLCFDAQDRYTGGTLFTP